MHKKVLNRRPSIVHEVVNAYKEQREYRENMIKMKGFSPDDKIRSGFLKTFFNDIEETAAAFNTAKNADRKNEHRPS